jgi:hypothetical protein
MALAGIDKTRYHFHWMFLDRGYLSVICPELAVGLFQVWLS